MRSLSLAIVYFNPLPSCEGRPLADKAQNTNEHISIHSPHVRGDTCRNLLFLSISYFNPLPSCEGRPFWTKHFSSSRDFNPLPSCEGRHAIGYNIINDGIFQSTPLM